MLAIQLVLICPKTLMEAPVPERGLEHTATSNRSSNWAMYHVAKNARILACHRPWVCRGPSVSHQNEPMYLSSGLNGENRGPA